VSSAPNALRLTTGAFDKVKAQDKPVLIDFWDPAADRGMSSRPTPW
jgi:hypothetical protein